nr:hypothetical protein [Bacteroidales bacterium]
FSNHYFIPNGIARAGQNIARKIRKVWLCKVNEELILCGAWVFLISVCVKLFWLVQARVLLV